MRTLSLLIALLLIAPGVAAQDAYNVSLYGDDGAEEFKVHGTTWLELEGTENAVQFTYTIRYVGEHWERTSMDSFRAILQDRNESDLGRTELDTYDLEKGNSTPIRGGRIVTSAATDQFNHILLEINHTATTSLGNTVDRHTTGGFRVPTKAPNQSITAFTTNVTEVMRGGMVYVAGEAEHVSSVNVSGTILNVDKGEFSGRVPVPTNVETGQQDVPFRVVTERGNVFLERLNVTVLNSPPTATLSYPDSIEEGDQLTLTVDASDDSAVDTVRTDFRQVTMINSSGVFNLPTEGLSEGTYSFNVSVVDDAGAKVSLSNNTFSVKPARNVSIDADEPEDDDGDGSVEQSDSIPIIGQIRRMIQDFLKSLLG